MQNQERRQCASINNPPWSAAAITPLRDTSSLKRPRAANIHSTQMSVGAAIALGAVLGLALGIIVSATTDVPLAPEAGLVLGALLGWLSRRHGA